MSRKIDFAQPSQWSRFEVECLKRIEEINQRSGARRHVDSSEGPPPRDEILYDAFENVAQNIVSLFRVKGWREFQAAAASATTMYKASIEASRRAAEQARALGKQQAVKELLGALVSAPAVYTNSSNGRPTTLLRRDDILALLSGLNNTPRRHSHSRHRDARASGRSMTPEVGGVSSSPPRTPTSSSASSESMRMFHEALVTIPNSPSSRRNDLGSFLVDQVHRYARKRKLTGNSGYATPTSPNRSPSSHHQPMESSPPPASKYAKHS